MLTHGPGLLENAKDQYRLQNEEGHQQQQRKEQVEHVEGVVLELVAVRDGELARVVDPGVDGDVGHADKHDQFGRHCQRYRQRRAVVHQLVADDGVDQQPPARRRNGGDVNRGEPLLPRDTGGGRGC